MGMGIEMPSPRQPCKFGESPLSAESASKKIEDRSISGKYMNISFAPCFLTHGGKAILMLKMMMMLLVWCRQLDSNELTCISEAALRNLHDMEILWVTWFRFRWCVIFRYTTVSFVLPIYSLASTCGSLTSPVHRQRTTAYYRLTTLTVADHGISVG